MDKTIVIPFGNELLVFTEEQMKVARDLGRQFNDGSLAERLLTAEEMAERTSIPAHWFLDQARQETIPNLKMGKYRRFQFSAVCSHPRFKERSE